MEGRFRSGAVAEMWVTVLVTSVLVLQSSKLLQCYSASVGPAYSSVAVSWFSQMNSWRPRIRAALTYQQSYNTAQHNTALHSPIRHFTAQYGTSQNNTALHSTTLHCPAQYCTAQNNTALHNTILHCTRLNNITLNRTTVHNTSLHPTEQHCITHRT